MKPRQYKQEVLILGEPGVGKRYLAHQIHSNAEFFTIDGLATNDQEVRGAISKTSNGSTLCVANIDSLAPHNQEAILSFLKERKKYRNLTVILTAYSLDRVEADLVKILKGFQTVELAPLRDRLHEIPTLTRDIVRDLCKTLGGKEIKIKEDTIRTLMRSSWPGNVRGLHNVLAKAVMTSSGDSLALPKDSLNEDQQLGEAIENISAGRDFVLDDSLWSIEKLLIERALGAFHHNQTRTASLFGLSEANFRYRLKKFGLPSIRKKS